jgi:hypothetical protein
MSNEPRYVLITECLQNDFFMNRDCRLFLPDHVVQSMLLGKQQYEHDLGRGSRRTIPRDAMRNGPLGLLLRHTIEDRKRGKGKARGTLHVINVRDWHTPDDSYDAERRSYGPHCEAGTWGAEYIEGLADLLDPADSPTDEEALYSAGGSVRVYHVHADSLFDFKPRAEKIGADQRKYSPSMLEDLLDVLVQGSDDDLAELQTILSQDPHLAAIEALGRRVDDAGAGRSSARVYVAVIGVYTDIKIKTVLTGLRTRYNVTNLAVSDTFTASAALERHLAGLDFAKKVLGVEVIHGITDLARFLGGAVDLPDESEVISADSYSRYQSFFQDQQNVLAYQHERLQDYLLLTEKRALKVYATINRSNRFLIAWGGIFLAASLVLSILAAFDQVDWEVPAVTGGLSLAQFVGVFFRSTVGDLQRNLTNLAVFKMILESHSLKTAFARYHLTTPMTLRELRTPEEAEAAARQVDSLMSQLAAIDSFDRADFEGLAGLGFSAEQATNGAAATTATTTEPS